MKIPYFQIYVRSPLRSKPNIRADWEESISPLLEIISDRFQRLSLKGVPFEVHAPATNEELSHFIDKTANIDPVLPAKAHAGQLQKEKLKNAIMYHEFKRNHWQEGLYVFQIRKCNDGHSAV